MNTRAVILILFIFMNSGYGSTEFEWRTIAQSSINIQSGHTHLAHNMRLVPGVYVFTAHQNNLDIILTLEKPSSAMVSVNSFIERNMPEELFFEVKNNGHFSFYIGAYNQSNLSSDVSFSIKQSVSNQNLQKYTQALLLQTKGSLSDIRGDLFSLDKAFEYLSQANGIWELLDDREQMAKLNYMIGLVAYESFMWDASENFLKGAIRYYQRTNQQVYGSVANHLGAALLEKKAYSEALDYLNKAIELQRGNNYQYDLGVSLNNKGLYYLYQGKNNESGKLFMQAAQIFENNNVLYKQAMSIGNYAVTELYQGRYFNAIELTKQCLTLLDQDLPKIRAAYLTNLALAQEKIGDIQNALLSLNQAKELQEAHADTSGLVWTLTGMADLARKILQFDIAINYQNKAVELARVQNEHGSLIGGLLNLAQDHIQLSTLQKNPKLVDTAILIFDEAMSIAKSDVHKAKSHLGLARAKYANKDFIGAEKSIDMALSAINNLDNPDVALLASMYLEKVNILPDRELFKKIDLLNQAKLILKETGNNKLLFMTYFSLAKAYLQSVELEKANSNSIKSLELFLSHRDRVGNPWLRNNLSKWYHQLVEIRLLILEGLGDKGAVEESLALVDSLKAISLREQIAESKVNLFKNLNDDETDLWQETQENLMASLKKADDLKQQKANITDINSAYVDIHKARFELETARAQLSIENPILAEFIYPQGVNLSDYQRWLKHQNDQYQTTSVIINYFIGDEKSFAWVISAEGVVQWSLPSRKSLNEILSSFKDSMVSGSTTLTESLYKLSSLLLPEDLPVNGHVYIVPDGQLNTFPFSLLVVEEGEGKQFLVEQNQLIMAPSSSLLLRNEVTKNDRKGPNKNRLLLVSGNIPGYDLTYTDTEISRIADAWKGSTDILKQEQNALDEFISLELEQFDYLHFATHGKVDEVVSDANGLAFNNGMNSIEYLNLARIYQLKLSSKLVTLSACNSGQGIHVFGEGIMGIARGFIYAGSDAVLATLWQISDRSTLIFMDKFYQVLNETHDSALALKATQQAAISGELGMDLRDFKSWAAFVLIGSD